MSIDVEYILRRVAEEMDITQTQRDAAETAYKAVGTYLQNKEDGNLVVDIHPQGSFNLGTVVRPSYENQEYDIDLVCLLNNAEGKKLLKDAKWIKTRVGEHLKDSDRYGEKLDEEGKRCWTLKFAEFHMDVLPCRSKGAEYVDPMQTAIELTNKDGEGLYSFRTSDPAGYRRWFEDRMKTVLLEARRQLVLNKEFGEIEKVPLYRVHTPLQRVVQLLKRHRDEFYAKRSAAAQKKKPISMIITTLAAKAYQGENTIKDALIRVLRDFAEGIGKDSNGCSAVWNPVFAEGVENFAEKWANDPDRETEFNRWLCQARNDFKELLDATDPAELFKLSRKYLGEAVSREIGRRAGFPDNQAETYPLAVFEQSGLSTLFKERYRLSPCAQKRLCGHVFITGEYLHKRSGLWMNLASNSMPLPKGRELRFRMKTDIQGAYSIKWQVVNRGDEAKGNLRGDFSGGKDGTDSKGPYHLEATAYSGTHYIVCYILQNGICVAQSAEFVVNIV